MFFCRHAESQGNIGIVCVDAPLTPKGIEQAKTLGGHFDCVIVSPLRRTIETLHYSNITYDHLIINNHFRERIFASHDQLLLEAVTVENDNEFFDRVNFFKIQLEEYKKKYSSILLIGHAYYFNTFYRQGCFPSPPHAQLIQL